MPGRKPSTRPNHCCYDYVHVTYSMDIYFPADRVDCDWCEFCHSENSGTRFRCYLTGEILPFHNDIVGQRCPLNIPQPTLEQEETEA